MYNSFVKTKLTTLLVLMTCLTSSYVHAMEKEDPPFTLTKKEPKKRKSYFAVINMNESASEEESQSSEYFAESTYTESTYTSEADSIDEQTPPVTFQQQIHILKQKKYEISLDLSNILLECESTQLRLDNLKSEYKMEKQSLEEKHKKDFHQLQLLLSLPRRMENPQIDESAVREQEYLQNTQTIEMNKLDQDYILIYESFKKIINYYYNKEQKIQNKIGEIDRDITAWNNKQKLQDLLATSQNDAEKKEQLNKENTQLISSLKKFLNDGSVTKDEEPPEISSEKLEEFIEYAKQGYVSYQDQLIELSYRGLYEDQIRMHKIGFFEWDQIEERCKNNGKYAFFVISTTLRIDPYTGSLLSGNCRLYPFSFYGCDFFLENFYPELFLKIRELAQSGDKMAQTNLAYLYDRTFLEGSREEHLNLYLKAALEGCPVAIENLGFKFMAGHLGLKRNNDVAIKLWKLAAAKGRVSARESLKVLDEARKASIELTALYQVRK